MDFSKELLTAKIVARDVGDYIAKRHKGEFGVSEKVANLDFVTDVDKTAEDKIRKALTATFPHYPFVGEEDDREESEIIEYLQSMKKEDICWVVDPLDGTMNFVQGLSGYCVSIGLVQGGVPIAGVIYLPRSEEMFYAEKGKGAWRNDEKIQVSATHELKNAFLSFSLPVVNMDYRMRLHRQLGGLLPKIVSVRAIGSAAQCIAYVAAGVFDAYWAIGLKPWDVAAGHCILAEAGGHITDYKKEPYRFGEKLNYCSNRAIDQQLLPYIDIP